jgi:4-hydroxy-3-polyprenylbenzoate decarboxylase
MLLAGFIRQQPVKLTRAVTVDLEVPAEAEIILEGYVDPEERRREGPFGDHTGYYSLADDYPVFHVTAITHRKQPFYSTTVVGRPPMEDCYLALATERIFLPLVRTIQPEITDYWLPWEGVFHNIVVVAIKKEYPGQARKVMQGLWGSGQMSFCKTIVVVDAHIPLGQGDEVIQSILTQIDLTSDVFLTDGILDALDHAAPNAFFGGKLGIDATARLTGEPPRRKSISSLTNCNNNLFTNRVKVLDEDITDCRLLFPDTPIPLLIVKIIKTSQKRGTYFRELLLDAAATYSGIIIFYDADIDLDDPSLLAWKAFNNVDPQRDITLKENFALVDATKKTVLDGHFRPWPDDLVNTAEIKQRVNARWQEYGIPL